ncbi:MAG: diguanylate cyclase [Pseudomonadota bacterium]|nr:diguanylate cyclase [Pseudomonadota bacterium]
MPNQTLQQIQAVLHSGFPKLHFPAELEQAYQQQHLSQAILTLRRNIAYVFAIYALLGIGIFALIPNDTLGIWPYLHLAVGVFVVVGGGCAFISRLDPWHQYYAALCACGGITMTIIGPYYLDNPIIKDIAQIGTLYVVIIAYTSLGLRFIPACIGSWLAGVVSLTYALVADLQLDWLVFHEMFTGANLMGMIMAYLAEHRNRTVYLQSRLLELEKQNSEEMARAMEKMSREDGLTGLANRRYFDMVYEREWRRAQRYSTPIAVMFIDIDHFKKYNDFYGHQQGDTCIKTIADIIGAQAKRAAELAARYGGEEFVVIYPQTNIDVLKKIGERTLAAVRTAHMPHQVSNTADIVTVSIGLACCVPTQSTDMEALLKLADENLYRSKANGRNQSTFSALPLE